MARIVWCVSAVAAVLAGGAAAAAAPAPTAQAMAGWAWTDWIDAAAGQAELIAEPVEQDHALTAVLWAECQMEGRAAQAAELAADLELRGKEHGASPRRRHQQLRRLAYAYARIGRMEEARRVTALIKPDERVWAMIQWLWALGERGEREAVLAVIDEVEAEAAGSDEPRRSWIRAELPRFLLFLDEPQRAGERASAVEDPVARSGALLWMCHLAIDLGRPELARGWLAEAQGLMGEGNWRDAWGATGIAGVLVRLGDTREAQALVTNLDLNPWMRSPTLTTLAMGYQAESDAARAEAWLLKAHALVVALAPDPAQGADASDVADAWSHVGVTMARCDRFDLLQDLWDAAGTPLNRSLIAAGVATEEAHRRHLVQLRGGGHAGGPAAVQPPSTAVTGAWSEQARPASRSVSAEAKRLAAAGLASR